MGMGVVLLATLLWLAQQDPSSVPDPDPTQQDNPFDLGMPGDSPTEDFGEPPRPEELFTVVGTIVSIAEQSLTLRRRGEIDAEFKVDERTAFALDGEEVTFDRIPAGSTAEVRYELRGDERVAREVQATSPRGRRRP